MNRYVLALLALVGFALPAFAVDEVTYELDRVIEVPVVGGAYEYSGIPFTGSVVAYDDGPSTPLREVHIEIAVCATKEAQQLGCQPYVWEAREQVWNWYDKGRTYILNNGIELVFVRRGRVAAGTSDPAIILARDGFVFVFQQVQE